MIEQGIEKKKKEVFEKTLNKNSQKGMLNVFFNRKKVEIIELSLLTSKGDKIMALRNKQCLEPKCLYDIKDIYMRFEKCRYNQEYAFECKVCGNYIKLKDFGYDLTMNQAIEEYWGKYNLGSEIQCLGIGFLKDGKYQPLLKLQPKIEKTESEEDETTYNDLMTEEFKGNFQKKQKKKLSKINREDAEKNGFELPNIEEYSENELEIYLNEFLESSDQSEDFLTIYDNSLTRKELYTLYSDDVISETIYTFFLKYMETSEHLKYKDSLKKRCFYSAFVLENFNRSKNNALKLEYEFLPGLDFNLKEKDFTEVYRAVFISMKYLDRWIGYVIYWEEGHSLAIIIDFLDPDLSMDCGTDFIDILKEFLAKNANFIKLVNFGFYKKKTINKYLDFGVYLMSFIMKFSEKFSLVENMKISCPHDKDKAKDVVLWMILKTKRLNNNKIMKGKHLNFI